MNEKLKCIIMDDEPVARKIVTEFVGNVEFLELAGSFENAIKASAFLQITCIDLIFLDIEMPKLSGIDFLRTMNKKPMVIITTAYPEYALEGYELDVIDYLVKPIAFSRFFKAVQKASDYNKHSEPMHDGYIFVRTDKRIEKIELRDILYIESLGNYVGIYTGEKKIIAYLTIKSIETQLPEKNFIKVHQSFVVNLSKVTAIENNEIKIKEKSIPISRSHKEGVTEVVGRRLLKR